MKITKTSIFNILTETVRYSKPMFARAIEYPNSSLVFFFWELSGKIVNRLPHNERTHYFTKKTPKIIQRSTFCWLPTSYCNERLTVNLVTARETRRAGAPPCLLFFSYLFKKNNKFHRFPTFWKHPGWIELWNFKIIFTL